jgi:CBS domain-containing protein
MFVVVNSENLASEIAMHHLTNVDRNTSVFEASKLMRKAGTAKLLVTRETGGNLLALGVVTARDFVTRVIAAGLDPSVLIAGDIAGFGTTNAGKAMNEDENRCTSEDH